MNDLIMAHDVDCPWPHSRRALPPLLPCRAGTLGAVNGVGQTVASAVRAAAPALGGMVWGWSASALRGLPAHQFVAFLLIAVVALGTLLVYYQRFDTPDPQPEPETAGHKAAAPGTPRQAQRGDQAA